MAFSVKNVNMSYDETNGSMLPGFKPTAEFFGMEQRFNPILLLDGDTFLENNLKNQI